eukprot:6181080-Pleurochrysis_carterae.AAC.4
MRRLQASMIPTPQRHAMRTFAGASSMLFPLRLKAVHWKSHKSNTTCSLAVGRLLSRGFSADGPSHPRLVPESQAGDTFDGPGQTAEARHIVSPDASPDEASSIPEPPAPVKHFVNLSNGVEAIEDLSRAGVPVGELAFCRIQSSHCEQNDYVSILNSLDANMLTYLALGFECRVYDFGSRGAIWSQTAIDAGPGKSEFLYIPRALWWGLEWQRYALNQLWLLPDKPTPLLHGYNVQKLFQKYFRDVPQHAFLA